MKMKRNNSLEILFLKKALKKYGIIVPQLIINVYLNRISNIDKLE